MEKDLPFQKLTPLDDTDIAIYEEAINFAFTNADIKNVAISGAYGAGKSSVLETYKKKHPEHSFLHISLAHFQDTENEDGGEGMSVNESVLEGKILNQLIHQIPTSKIPQTNFKVKKQVNARQTVWTAVLISVLVGCFAYLFLYYDFVAFVKRLSDGWIKGVLSWLFHPYTAVGVAVVCAISSAFGIYWLIWQQKTKSILHKITLRGNEIELFANQDDSFFDKYLNEVLYLFDNVDESAVVFEDMDRFNANQIFERLREVNTLVNIRRRKRRQADSRRRKRKQADPEKAENIPLRFFYLLRDDIFETKDRTKFFDYIVPIVPVVDGSNSYEKFADLLRKANLLQEFDLSFLQGLCLYIDDMRVLKNIYNEFIVYFNRLNKTALNCNKMLAVIVYKNLFPRDCGELQLGRGFVAALFEHKEDFAERTVQSLRQEQQKLRARLELAEREHLCAKEEVDEVYNPKIERFKNTMRYRRMSEDEEKQLRQLEQERSERKQAISDRNQENQEAIKAQIDELENQIEATTSKRLKDLITRETIGDVFGLTHKNEIGDEVNFEDVKSNYYFDLLKFLIRNGYIDETYSDYMTYFYEGSISRTDKIFLRRITDKRGADYTYRLKEPQRVVDSPLLRTVEFKQEETLNFDLLECLLQNSTKQPAVKYLEALMGQLKDTENFDFISKFYDTGREHAKFVAKLDEQWPEFFAAAQKSDAIAPDQLRQFSVETLYYAETSVIEQANVEGCLTAYISGSPDYLNIEDPDVERLVAGLLLLKVSFFEIDYDKADKKLFEEVYEHSLYVLSFENIKLMLQRVYGITNEDAITCKNYTVIHDDPESPLAKYVDAHLPEYMNILLAYCGNESEIADDAIWAISLLNSEAIDAELKVRYIAVLTTEIISISDLTDNTLWGQLLDRECVVFTTENLVQYFIVHGLDEHLIGYINSLPAGLSYVTIGKTFGDDTELKLYKAVVGCNDITNEIYREIVAGLGYYFDDYSEDGIADDKIGILIEQGLIRMNKDALNYVREKHGSQLRTFVSESFERYLEVEAKEGVKLEEVQEILAWQIDVEQKIALLKLTSEPISIKGKDYPDEIMAYILTNNYESEDIAYLCANYSRYKEEIRKLIILQCESQLPEILAENMAVDDALLSVLFVSPNIDKDDKIRLFTNSLPSWDEEACKRHFEELGVSELGGIFSRSGGRKKYEKSEMTTGILKALKQHGWIYEYQGDGKDPERYIVIKNQPKKMID